MIAPMHAKQNLRATLFSSRCDRDTLIPMIEKLDEREALALLRLLRSLKDEAKSRRPYTFHPGMY